MPMAVKIKVMSVAYKIQLPEAIAERLEASAKERKMAAETIASRAVVEYLEDQEDLRDALARTSDPNRKLLTTKEVKRNLGL